ncbi:MAG: LPS export ABC transporter permease LptF [Oxalobacter sp.]|nr:LPS export ABC transporter permease LptF [Oxalobacter sp.]
MIFQRALKRELYSTAAGVFLTLFTITITMMLIRILGQAAKGKIASDDVLALIGFTSLNYMPIILILTAFIAVLLVVTRSYRDSEMVVWFSSGLSLTRWIRPVLEFGAPIIVLVAVLGFSITPWAYRQSAEFRERFEKREDLARLSPGKFQESASGNRVFYIESIDDDGEDVKNVFIHSIREDRIGTVLAESGRIFNDSNGDRFMLLRKGLRYEEALDHSFATFLKFGKYTSYVAEKDDFVYTLDETSTRSLTMKELLQRPTSKKRGELVWRIGLPFMCTLLMLLAIPLGFVNPRAGRSFNLIIAVLLYLAYSNMTSFFQNFVSHDRLSFGMAWWPLHLLIAIIVFLLFAWRLGVNSPHHPYAWFAKIRRKRIQGLDNKEGDGQ